MSQTTPKPITPGGFDASWLQQREPFDLAARSQALATAFAAALPRGSGRPVRLVDLAAGTGANFRALAPLIGGDQDWLLIDHDPLLLAAQHAHIAAWATQRGWHSEPQGQALRVQTGSACWRVQGQALDLAASWTALDLARFDGVTTTAFLDLVSAAWLETFSQQVAQARRPLLATLTVDGQRLWLPAHPADAALQAAFLQHQGVDKGFGPALGAAALAHLAELLSAQGLVVHTARSDWRISATDPNMLTRMVSEAAAVARDVAPGSATHIADWLATRRVQIHSTGLQLTVGHGDLLAL